MEFKANAFSSFSVDDMDRAREFYSGTLGLEVREHPMGVLDVFPEGGAHFMIYPRPDHQPASFTVYNFLVAHIGKAVKALNGKGVRFEQYEGAIKTDEKGIHRSGGHRIAWFRDPAGNILSLIEDPELPRGTNRDQFVIELNQAYAQGDAEFIISQVTEDIEWEMVGDTVIRGKEDFMATMEEIRQIETLEMKINRIITIEDVACADGKGRIRDAKGVKKDFSFCDIYEFSPVEPEKIRKMTSYIVPGKTGKQID